MSNQENFITKLSFQATYLSMEINRDFLQFLDDFD